MPVVLYNAVVNKHSRQKKKGKAKYMECLLHPCEEGHRHRIFWRSMAEVKSKLWRQTPLYSLACKSLALGEGRWLSV